MPGSLNYLNRQRIGVIKRRSFGRSDPRAKPRGLTPRRVRKTPANADTTLAANLRRSPEEHSIPGRLESLRTYKRSFIDEWTKSYRLMTDWWVFIRQLIRFKLASFIPNASRHHSNLVISGGLSPTGARSIE